MFYHKKIKLGLYTPRKRCFVMPIVIQTGFEVFYESRETWTNEHGGEKC